MFAVHSINEERNTASSLRADFLYPNLNQYGYSTPSSSVNAPTALREWNAEGKAVPSLFYSPNKHNSVMHSTEKNVCRGSVVSPSDTCPSYENARRNRLAAYRRLSQNFPVGALHPEKLFMFAVSYISKERDAASDLGADFLYPHLSTYRYSTPSWQLNGSTAPCECRTEGKAVPSFYLQSNKHNSVMSYTEKKVCRGSLVSPSDTCPSYENARLRLTFLRLTIMSWMETAIRSEFPHATKARYRIRKGRRGRCTFYASVRSHGVYLSFHSVTLDGLSEQIRTAAATHRLATGGATNNIQSL